MLGDKNLVVIVGPTAVGKTGLSIRLAQRLGGEIVSADSRLFYRGMDIGTAKPTLEERALVPHHLIDVAEPDQVWSLAAFQHAAARAIEEIHFRGRIPLLVGGTGQYVRAVLEGWQPPAMQADMRLREVLEAWGREIGARELNRRLALIDPVGAANSDTNNLRRTVRALEVMLRSGVRFSEQRGQAGPAYRALVIGLDRPREELYARADARIAAMLRGGLLEEAQALLAKRFSPDLPTLSAIGYKEAIAVLQGRMSLQQAEARMRQLTHQFIRRQANWFRPDDAAIRWFRVQAGVEDVIAEIIVNSMDC
jgi:tRNA dimethylallyltransferase